VIFTPSPNFTERRHGLPPDMVVLHYTAMQSAKAAIARLCDPAVEVSAHYVISEQGIVTQLVAEDMRAWHAGAGAWGDVVDVNSHSIGIELANCSTPDALVPFPAPQMDALVGLLTGIFARWNIAPERVIGHSDMAPTRKCDPGPKFDWQRLARQGLSVWPKGTGQVGDFAQDAQRFGYRCEDSAAVLSAFRARFLPCKTGSLDAQDRAVMRELTDRWGCL